MQVRSLMTTDENMFKITLKEGDNSVNIQFVSLDDLTINDHENAEEKYNYYVTSYVMSHPTEGVSASKINMPFSKPFIESVDEDQCDGRVNTGLKVSVCENSYRLFFEADTHDEFTSNFVYNKQSEDSKDKSDKVEKLKSLINNEETGWKLTVSEENTDICEEKVKLLFEKGANTYTKFVKEKEAKNDAKEEEQGVGETGDEKKGENYEADNMDIESSNKDEKENSVPTKLLPPPTISGKANHDNDADTTVIQENNDTTIQQDGNDTTTDETTVNQDDASMLVEGQQSEQTSTSGNDKQG